MVLVLVMFVAMVLVCALKKRKERKESKMESDWVPGVHKSEDITYNNLQHDDDDLKEVDYFDNHGQQQEYHMQ